MWRQFVGMQTPSSTCGGTFSACGDLFFKSLQSSCFINYPISISSSVELSVLNFLRSLFSRHCGFCEAVTEERPGIKGVASKTRSSDGQNREPEFDI